MLASASAAAKAPEPDSVVAALCESVDRFCARHVRAQEIDAAGRIPLVVIEGLAALGVFGATLPAEHGGGDLGLVGAAELIETLARHDRSVATTVGLHLGLGTRALVEHGSAEQHARYLPSLASGETIAAFATTEPAAGSDLSAIGTTLTEEADLLRLRGQKAFVTNGGLACLFTVAARTKTSAGAAATTLVLVERGDKGVVQLGEERKLGLRGSSTTGFVFEDVALPRERVLGALGSGQAQLDRVLAWGRLLMSAGCVGTAQAALDRALRYTAERRQFGKRLDEQPVVRMLTDGMRARVAAMRAMVRAAAATDGETLARLSASAKVFCSESAWRVGDTALQLHGGSGYIEDTGLALLLRDARVTRIFEGANEVLLTQLGLLELSQRTTFAERTAGAVHELARRVEAHRQRLHEEQGVRVVRDKLALYRLGQAVILRDAALAAERTADPDLARAFANDALRDAVLHLGEWP